MQYGDQRCRKCNCKMELIADAPPMNGSGLVVWSCPQCDAIESVLTTKETRNHQRVLRL
jgi:phage FluMu protein Com